MSKDPKSSHAAEPKRNLVIVLILVAIALVVTAVILLPRITGGRRSTEVILAENQQVDVEEAYQLVEEGVLTVDLRTARDWQAGHIPGAILIPLDELAVRSGELPVGKPILFYCHTGELSLEAINMLGDVGFMNLASLDGGLREWVIAGYPLEGGD